MTNLQILDAINQNIKRNENKEITGVILNSVLRMLLDFVNQGFITFSDIIQLLADSKAINVVGSINPDTITTDLPNGVYHAKISGNYPNAGNIVVKDGYYTLLRKDNDVWSLESEVKMPSVDIDGNIVVGQTTKAVNGDKIARYISNTSFSIFRPAVSAIGYDLDSVVYYNDKLYKSLKPDNKTLPTDATKWKEIKLGTEVDQKFIPTSENAVSAKAIHEEYKVLDDMFSTQKEITTFVGAINGQYLKSDGSLVGGTSLFTSPYYEGVAGDVFKANFGNTHLVFYKADKTIHSIIVGQTDWHNSHYEHIITIPEGARYFRYSFYQDSPVVAYCYKLEKSIKTEFLEEPINQIFGKEGSEGFEYGFYTGNKTSVATGGYGFLQKNFIITADSKITTLKCNVSNNGKVKIWVLRLDKWSVTYNTNRTYEIDVVAGNNTIAVNIDVFKDEIIGLTAVGANSLKFSESGGGLGAFFSTVFNSISKASLSSQGEPYAGDFSFTIAGAEGGMIWKVNQLLGNPNQKEVDKSLLIIGDSNSDVQYQKWVTEFAQDLKFKKGYKNVALSGARLGFSGLLDGQNLTRATGYGQVLESMKDSSFKPDVVIIFLGVNDNHSLITSDYDTVYNKSINYVTEASLNPNNTIFNSIMGGFRLTVDKLQTVYPDCEIVVITPAGLSDTRVSEKISKCLIELSWRSGCKLLDLYGRCGINQMLEPKYTDGLHYSDIGGKYIGKKIANELYKLIN